MELRIETRVNVDCEGSPAQNKPPTKMAWKLGFLPLIAMPNLTLQYKFHSLAGHERWNPA